MENTKIKHGLYIGLLLLTLNACNSQSTQIIGKDNCIDSFEVFAYTRPDKNDLHQEPTLPLDPWIIESELPDVVGMGYPYDIFDVEATRFMDAYEEIWLKPPDSVLYFLEDVDHYQFLVFRTDTEEWKSVPSEIEETGVVVNNLMVDLDGNIWGQNYWDVTAIGGEFPILSKYNDVSGQFEFDRGVQGIPALWEGDTSIPHWGKVLYDPLGTFWIIVPKDGIYRYDPSTQEARRIAEIPDILVDQVALAPDGSVFLTTFPSGIGINTQEVEFFHFIPETGVVEVIEAPQGLWPMFARILVDHSGRLWLDTVGWLDPEGEWYKLYPNPLFYYWKMMVEDDYRWATPQIILVSSDGRIWYRQVETSGRGGLAWYDPQSESGCWFTTQTAYIVEDQQRILWMVADGSLYKYQPTP